MLVQYIDSINKVMVLLAISLLFNPEQSSGNIDVLPFISFQSDGKSSYPVITYYSTRNKLNCLEYAEVGKEYTKVCNNDEEIKKIFYLKNLSQDTLYHYRIGNRYDGSFKTPSIDFKPFSLIAVGHTGGTQPIEAYPKMLLADYILQFNPNLLIHTGDVVWGPSYDNYKEFINDFQGVLSIVPIAITPGNHDIDWPYGKVGNNSIKFKDFFSFSSNTGMGNGQRYYFKYNDVLFISIPYYNEDYSPGSLNLKWLKKVLEQPSKYKIAFLGGGQYYWMKDKNIRNIFPFLKDNGVDIILAGDSVGVEYQHLSGIPYVFTGSRGEDEFPVSYLEIKNEYIKIKQMVPSRVFNSDVYFKNTSIKRNYLLNDEVYNLLDGSKEYGVPIIDRITTDSDFIIKIRAKNSTLGHLNIKVGHYKSALKLNNTSTVDEFYFLIPNNGSEALTFSLSISGKNIKNSFLIESVQVYRYIDKSFKIKCTRLGNRSIISGENNIEFEFVNKGAYPIENYGKYAAYFLYVIMDENQSVVYRSKNKIFPEGRKIPHDTWVQSINVLIPNELKKGSYTYILSISHNINNKNKFSLFEVYKEHFNTMGEQ